MWQESWAHPGQHGFRMGRGTIDAYWTLALKVEAALISGQPLSGVLLDYSKCFDRLPHNIMLKLAERLGPTLD